MNFLKNLFNIFFINKFFNYKNFFCLNLFTNCITNKAINININMINCLIFKIYSSTNGGAIFINSAYNFSINETTFYECIVTTNGLEDGAIYITNGLNIQLYKICALYCKATNYQFSYLSTNKNQNLDLITLSKCFNKTLGCITIRLYYGNQKISQINSTYNYNIYVSGIQYFDPNSMDSIYCTFYNNSVSDSRCINLVGNTGNINKSNIIINNSPSLYYGVVYVYSGSYSLYECIFDKNQNILLYVRTGSLTINNCYINHYNSNITTNLGTNPIFSPFLIESITKYYTHNNYKTFYCSGYNFFDPTITNIPDQTFGRTFPPIPTIERSYPLILPIPTIERSYPLNLPIPTIERSYYCLETHNNNMNNSFDIQNNNHSYFVFTLSSLISLIIIFIITILIILKKKTNSSSETYSSN